MYKQRGVHHQVVGLVHQVQVLVGQVVVRQVHQEQVVAQVHLNLVQVVRQVQLQNLVRQPLALVLVQVEAQVLRVPKDLKVVVIQLQNHQEVHLAQVVARLLKVEHRLSLIKM